MAHDTATTLASVTDQPTHCRDRNRARYRLAVLASHPIQYQAPLFRALARCREIDLRVFFCSRRGAARYRDPGFGRTFRWDVPLLEGYTYTFLRNLSPRPGSGHSWGFVNPGIVAPILRGGFDAIWIHGWALATNWFAWAGAAARGMPLLLRGESNGLSEPAGLGGIAKRALLKTFFSRVAGFLAIGTRNADFYASYGVPEERIFWTPYAVDNDFFIGHAARLAGHAASLREQAGLPPDRPVILFCGKFLQKKRPLDLLRAFALLDDSPASSLILVGDGPLRADIEAFIASHRLTNVRLLGFRNQKELTACYAMADLLVLPSSFEPWGLVLNEAMCFGLPVIASNRVGAAADLVRDGINGFTYPAGNVAELADRLRRVLADEKALRRMGSRSRAIVSGWGIEEDLRGVSQCLSRVVGDHGST